MGKNYIENSLKRFLKRKVKITLGMIVTFLITGTLGFAEVNMPENKNESWLEGIGIEKKIDNTTIKFNEQGTTALEIKDNVIVIKKDGKDDISIELKDLSDEVYNNIKTAVKLGENAVNAEQAGNDYSIDGTLPENYKAGLGYKDNVGNTLKADGNNKYSVIEAGTISSETVTVESGGNGTWVTGQYAKNGGIVVNKGIINIQKNGKVYAFGQQADITSTAINYGIIKNEGIGAQRGTNLYNYGILLNSGDNGQQGNTNTNNLYNYGIIANSGGRAQTGNKVKNYGILMNGGTEAQYIGEYGYIGDNYGIIANGGAKGQSVAKGGVVNNYGLIDVKEEGQYAYTDPKKSEHESFGYNYGVINTEEKGQVAQQNSKVYNYGIIHSKKTAQEAVTNSAAYNYGVLYNHEGNIVSTPDYSGTEKSHNYGILITEGDEPFKISEPKDELINNGIVLKREGNKLSIFDEQALKYEEYKNAEEYVSGKVESGTAEKSNDVFINNLDSNKKTTVTEMADNLVNTHITTAVTNEVGTVISKNGNLTLNNSSIVGYFEKNGTLLNVNGNLTLEGNSVINAITGNEYTGYTGDKLDDVVAVKLSNNGKLEIKDSSMVLGAVEGNGTMIYENIDNETYFNRQDIDSMLINTTAGETTEIALGNVTLKDSGTGVQDAGKLMINNQSDKKLEDKEVSTSITLANNINIQNGIDGSKSTQGIELILGDGQKSSDNSIKVGGEILLGQSDDTIIINNILGKYDENQKTAVIDGGEKDDTVILKNLNGNHDTFDYALKNIETLDLNNQTWKIGENASIEFGNSGTITKATDKIAVQNGTLMGELKGDKDTGASFENSTAVDSVLGNSSFGDNAKFQMGIGKDMVLEAGAEYNIEDTLKNNLANNVGKDKITSSGIFTHAKEDTDKELRVKTAEEMGINGRYSEIYNQMLENADKEEVRDILNNTNFKEIASLINSKGAMADTLATSGYKITRDISNSFISSVNEWNKKANKGEWLANAKYINSDIEYDGANNVKGYDSDITSMVGMIEYGVSDNTSYGIALGGGDTEVDVTGAGTLEGDNYYIGAYAKHSVNGFDLVGNLGYTISDLEVDGNGNADSSAITFAGYVKRDIRLSETIEIEPNLAFTYDYIIQDDAEGNGVKVENKDIHVFEATAGMNIVKEFALNNGNLELKAGIKYSMADINRNEETIMVSVLSMENTSLGNSEVDKTRGTAHIGFDYEHETGFGVNGKYETMWSDSGDDSRITAGISYRF